MKVEPRPRSERAGGRSFPLDGPDHVGRIIAELAGAAGRAGGEAAEARSSDILPHERPAVESPEGLRDWLLHETTTLRHPIYRTSAEDQGRSEEVATEPTQLPLIRYDYGPAVSVISQLGELTARDLRVMSVISQVFYENGCPEDNGIFGDEATLGFICRQLGLSRGFAGLVRSSVERLATSKVLMRSHQTISDSSGAAAGAETAEVAVGFLTNWGVRRRKVAGQREMRNNFILIDPLMAKLIRDGHFTWLRADVMRRLRNDGLATKYYTFMRTHRPNDRGEIEYGIARLATALGCSDKKRSRVRGKILRAAQAVCQAAPEEFPRVHVRAGVHDAVIVQAKARRVPLPVRVIEGGGQGWGAAEEGATAGVRRSTLSRRP